MYCAICFGSGTQGQWTALYCGHVFHHDCIQQSFAIAGPNCPHCRERKKGPKGELFFKLFIDDDPHGGSESPAAVDGQEDDPVRLRNKIELLNSRIEAMTHTIEEARAQSNRDRREIANLKLMVQQYAQELTETSARLQSKINEYNSTAAQNKRLQNEYASAKLNLERERAANSRSRLAFDTSISSRELSAQLTFLAEGGHSVPDYFQKLLEVRNKALTEANSRVHKADAARLTAVNSAKEESKKFKLQIQDLKLQIEEYQEQLETLRQQQQQQQQPSATNNNNRKRPAPPSWLAYAETEDATAAELREGGGLPATNRPRQSQQRQTNPNFISGSGAPPTKTVPSKPNPIPRVPAFDLGSEIDGLLGPSSELPDMRPPAPIVPPPQRMTDDPAPAPPVAAPVGDTASHLAGAADAINGNAAGDKPRNSKILEFRKRLLERKQAEAAAAAPAAAATAGPASSGLVGNNSNPGAPIEWGTEIENAAADVDEEQDVIELISDSEEEENKATGVPGAPQGRENDPRALNNQQQQQQRPPSKAAISFLAAGPSKIALASAPGTSFIRDPKFATTGLKDDATFIQSGPDGKGGRTTYYRGQQSHQNKASGSGSRPAPAWGATMRDHVAVKGNGSGSSGIGKRGKNSTAAGSTVPISNYFGRANSNKSS